MLQRLRADPIQRRCAVLNLIAAGRENTSDLGYLLARVDSADFTIAELNSLTSLLHKYGRGSEVVPLLQRSAGVFKDPRDRYFYFLLLENELRSAGRTEQAEQQRRALAAGIARAGSTLLQYRNLIDHAALLGSGAWDRGYAAAAAIAESRGAFTYCADALDRLVHRNLDTGAMAEAIAIAPRAIACADTSGIPFWQSVTRARYGRALSKAGNFAQAERVLQQALPYAVKTGSPYEIADVWHNLAHNYEAAGKWSEARLAVVRFAENAGELAGDPINIVSLRDAGIIFWDSGEPAAARRYFERMVSLTRSYHHEAYWAGEYSERVGDLEQARMYYHAALLEGGDTGRITTGLVRVYQAIGAFDSAAAAAKMHDRASFTPEEVPLQPELAAQQGRFDDALRIARSFADRQQQQHNINGVVNALLQEADIAWRAGRRQLSLDAASRAERTARGANLNTERIKALILMGRAAADARAIVTLTRAAHEARRSGQPLIEADAWGAVTDKYLDRSDDALALTAMDSALHARGHTRDTFEDAFDRVRYEERVAQRLDRGAWHAVEQKRPERLYEWEVRRKANRPPARSLADLRKRLSARDVVLDYVVTDSGVAALIVSKARVAIVPLKTNTTALQQLVLRLRAATTPSFGEIDFSRARFDYGAAQALFDALVQPLQIAGSDWVIVPDGVLHLMPFDALVWTQDGQRRFLIERMTSTYAQAPDILASAGSVDLHSLSVVAAAAPGEKEEIAAVRAAVPAARVFSDATEQAARRAVRAGGVLHFTVHAQASADLPLSSYLKLKPDGDDDGLYHLNEIGADRPHAKLVVLSACATLAGRVYRAGPFSIARAFTSGPQTSVVATEWPVGESAASFTAVFYQQLRRGVAVAAAVRSAKLAMKQTAATANPLLWAPFVVLRGEPF